jgi:hypothetical protein
MVNAGTVEKEIITVTDVAEDQYGTFVRANGKRYGEGKFFKGMNDLKAGGTYEVEVYTGPQGGKKIQKLISSHPIDKPETVLGTTNNTVATGNVPPLKNLKPKSESMTKEDWSAKDRSQLIGGLCHDAAQITASLTVSQGMDKDGALEVYKDVLNQLINFRSEVK